MYNVLIKINDDEVNDVLMSDDRQVLTPESKLLLLKRGTKVMCSIHSKTPVGIDHVAQQRPSCKGG